MGECYCIVHQDYDSTVTVCVYERRDDAERVLADVRAYCDASPWPSSLGMDDSDAAFAKWERALKKWNKRHPLGEEYAYYRNDFQIWPIPYYAAIAAQATPND